MKIKILYKFNKINDHTYGLSTLTTDNDNFFLFERLFQPMAFVPDNYYDKFCQLS